MKDFWNERYAEEGLAYGETPNEYLTTVVSHLPAGGKILVVGDGEGRNGVWLAEQGFDVLSIDYSQVAVEKIKSLAALRNVCIHAECHDLTQYEWPKAEFDAVVAIYLHFPPDVRQAMHEKMFAALKLGGKIVIEAFHKEQLKYPSGGPPVEAMLFSEDMLKQDFAHADILELYETITHLNEGKYHVGEGAVVRLLAQKI